ncbi:MAG: DUF3863 domain-containing protein [Candidatus Moduliflexus flocculans]|nr:DUF3863 domain-containing protein [Candidatus Moduliflexus flocculans]
MPEPEPHSSSRPSRAPRTDFDDRRGAREADGQARVHEDRPGPALLAAGALPAGARVQAGPAGRGRREVPRRAEDPDLQFRHPRQPDRGHPDAERGLRRSRQPHARANVRALRDAFAAGWPGAPMTWAFSWRACSTSARTTGGSGSSFRDSMTDYGDDVTFIPGAYFANAYNTRDAGQPGPPRRAGPRLRDHGRRLPAQSVIAGFLAAANQRYPGREEGIHVCQGNIWSQYAIDNQDGEGSISYPYYPSTEHFCKPAQGAEDFIDCVNLDGWTCDFLAARRQGQSWARLPAQPHGRRAHRDDRMVRPRGRAGPDRRDDGGPLRHGLRPQRLGLGHELLGGLARSCRSGTWRS